MKNDSAPSRSPARALTNAAFFATFFAFMVLLTSGAVIYGSRLGRWHYSYAADTTGKLLLAALGCGVALVAAYWISDRFVERFRVPVVAAWLVIGFAFSVYARRLYVVPLPEILKSDTCMSFYSAAKKHEAAELLRNYGGIAPGLALHSATNMPGKTLLVRGVLSIRKDATRAAYMLIALTVLAGVLVFAIAERWFRDRRVALLALVLYLLLPSKLNFMPVPNTLTPAFILLPLWLLLLHLERARDWLLAALGVSLYVLFIFEPLPFTLGLVFVGAIARRWADGTLDPRSVWKLALVPGLGFFAAYFAMKLGFGFDAFETFAFMYEDAVAFNQRENRPYDVWVVMNVVEFLIGLGVLSAVTLLVAWVSLGAEAFQRFRRDGFRPGLRALSVHPVRNLLSTLFATLLVLDLWGVNRGEITRLWIFVAVVAQIAVAGFCVERFRASTRGMVVGACAAQALISTATVAFFWWC